jgi:hypothetical protein
MLKKLLACLACAALLAPAAASAAQTEVGKLDCDVSAGIGVIIGSKQAVSCMFTPSAPGPKKSYQGSIDEFGLDIGEVQKGRMVWLVYSINGQPLTGLQGTYRGVEADASLGLGGGAKVLVGGSQSSVSLQPVSLEGDVGVNVAVGVASLRLRAVD